MKLSALLTLLGLPFVVIFGQPVSEQISLVEEQISQLKAEESVLLDKLENLKLEQVREDLKIALPKMSPEEKLIEHLAMSLVYSEKHEQAKWVAHIITPGVMEGNVSRSNDFRPDPFVETGTAVEEDYFLKYLQPDSTYEYDGFGYDRGHLAPSADFRWSAKALSESYYYSNMSPQVAEFNREKWAELEGLFRGYIYEHPNTQLYVVTGPILKDGLPVIERGPNKVSIPELFFKAGIDLVNKKAVGFIMPNKPINYPIRSFAVSIDKIEEETGLDLFCGLSDDLEIQLEQQIDVTSWLPEKAKGDVEPIYPPSLPKHTFNTVQAKSHMGSGKKISVCGTVVSTKQSRKGNIFLNLDKQFPNQIFTVFIRKEHQLNFTYNPVKELEGIRICVEGEVTKFGNTPTMFVEREEQVTIFED